MMVILEVFFIRFGWFSSFAVANVHTMDMRQNTLKAKLAVTQTHLLEFHGEFHSFSDSKNSNKFIMSSGAGDS